MVLESGIREDVLYRGVLPPELLRAILTLDSKSDVHTVPRHVEAAIKEYLHPRGIPFEESDMSVGTTDGQGEF